MPCYFVTFPRSGHHVVINTINDIAKTLNLEYSYCEYYNHNSDITTSHFIGEAPTLCSTYPCNSDCMVIKTHDYNLNPKCYVPDWKAPLNIKPDYKYIVMYREDKVKQFDAWYRHYKSIIANGVLHTAFEFYVYNKDYYQAFIRKWVESKHDENILKITYEQLVESPLDVIMDICIFLYPECVKLFKENIELIKNIVVSHQIEYKHKMSYDEYLNLQSAIEKYDNII